METSEVIGIAIVAVAILAMTFQTAFAYGARCGQNKERLLANRRINGVLDYENSRKPKSQRAKRKQVRKAARLAVGSVGLVTLLGGLQ